MSSQESPEANRGQKADDNGGGVGKTLIMGFFWPYALMGSVVKSKHGVKVFGGLLLIAGLGGFLEYQRDAAPPSDAEIQWAILNAEAINAEEARLTKLQAEIMDHLANGQPELASIKITALVWDPVLRNPYLGGKTDPHQKKWSDINLKLRTTGVRSGEKVAASVQDSQSKD